MIRWLRRLRRGHLVDECCRECFEQLRDGATWETVVHFATTSDEAAFGGGTFGTAYWCRKHRPADARRTRRGTLPSG